METIKDLTNLNILYYGLFPNIVLFHVLFPPFLVARFLSPFHSVSVIICSDFFPVFISVVLVVY